MRKYWMVLLLVSAWWLVQWQTAPQVCNRCCVLESPSQSYDDVGALAAPWTTVRPRRDGMLDSGFMDPWEGSGVCLESPISSRRGHSGGLSARRADSTAVAGEAAKWAGNGRQAQRPR